MANDEHVALLKKSVTAWNEWRLENESTRPDLSGADLTGADLTGASEMRSRSGYTLVANLRGADLSGADKVHWPGMPVRPDADPAST
jgi:uncharacterized protein YjbI with pentapeptide repeats